jgi:archaellum biogenesis ATPase FlaH
MTNEVSKELVQGVLLGKFPCSACSSRDNLAVYIKYDANGKEYLDGSCFSPDCSHKFWTEEQLREEGILEEGFVAPKVKLVTKTAITKAEYKALTARTSHDTTQPDGSLYRGIRPDVAKFYNVLFERNSEGWITKVYYPETKSTFKGECGSLRGYKTRVLPKDFSKPNIGITGVSSDFYGRNSFKDYGGAKYVVIVGGEEDCLAAYQMLRDYQVQKKQEDYDAIPVVSVTSGEGSLAKQCAEQYDWLDQFENIIVCMDNDDAGRKATQEALKVLPEGKARVMYCSLKDPSLMLQEGKHKQFLSNFWDAKTEQEAGVNSIIDAMDGVQDYLLAPKIPLPPQLAKIQEAMRGGIRSTGSIINIIGKTSIGKTLFSDMLLYFWRYYSPLKPVIFSIERTKEELLIDMFSIHLKQNLTWFSDGHDAVDYLNQPEIAELCEDFIMDEFGEPSMFVIDERRGNVDVLKKQIERAVKQYNSKLVIIDVLTDVLRSLPLNEQDDFMLWEKQMKKEGIVFINVCHTRKDQAGTQKPKDENGEETFKRVDEYDIHGTSSIPQSADYNIVLNRNKNASDPIEKNTTYVDLPKARGGTTSHNVLELYYDPITRQQVDREVWLQEQRTNF